MINGNQVRAARGLLNWTLKDLAKKASLQPTTITDFENASRPSTTETIQKITDALIQAGIEFTATGVQLTAPIYGFQGDNWFIDLLNDIDRTGAMDVIIMNADDRKTPENVLGIMRQLCLKGIKFRLTIEEGNTHLTLPISSYRALPKKYFENWVTVIYGDRVAFSIQNETGCRIIRDADLAASMLNQFNYVWDSLNPLDFESTAHDFIK